MEMLDVLKSRRSCRKFSKEMVSDENIKKVIEAGLYAPSSKNIQTGIILTITNKEVRDKLSVLNAKIGGREGDPFYGAPVVFLVLVKKGPNCVYDGSIMIENMLVEAEALGLGSIWIHRAKEELESAEGKEILKDAGLDFDEYEGIGHVCLGHSLVEEYPAKNIKDGRVIYIK